MRLPKQTPSVDRSVNNAAQASANGSFAPSGFLDVLGGIAQAALPAIASAI